MAFTRYKPQRFTISRTLNVTWGACLFVTSIADLIATLPPYQEGLVFVLKVRGPFNLLVRPDGTDTIDGLSGDLELVGVDEEEISLIGIDGEWNEFRAGIV